MILKMNTFFGVNKTSLSSGFMLWVNINHILLEALAKMPYCGLAPRYKMKGLDFKNFRSIT